MTTKMAQTETLKKLGRIERDLQALKISLLLGKRFPKNKDMEQYQEKDILKEVKKIRGALWNERYSKSA